MNSGQGGRTQAVETGVYNLGPQYLKTIPTGRREAPLPTTENGITDILSWLPGLLAHKYITQSPFNQILPSRTWNIEEMT